MMRRLARVFGSGTVMGALLYLTLMGLLHALRTDYNPARRFLSEYSVGEFGLLGTAAFCALAATLLFLALGLRATVRPALSLAVACTLLGIAAVAFLASAAFPTDIQPLAGGRAVPTRSGAIHDVSALVAFLSLIPAFLALPRAYAQDEAWRSFSRVALLFGLSLLAFFVAFILVPWSIKGLAQRACAAVIVLGALFTGIRIRRRFHA
jgi:hypothetical protein